MLNMPVAASTPMGWWPKDGNNDIQENWTAPTLPSGESKLIKPYVKITSVTFHV